MAARRTAKQAHPGWGWLCIALGLYPLALAGGWLPVTPDPVDAPPWVLALCGLVFISGGCLILLRGRGHLQHLLAAIIAASFALVGMWVALLAPAEGFSGGLFFLSPAANVRLARWVFGLGALISLALFAYALFRFNRGDD